MGELRGPQLQPGDIAAAAYAVGWTDAVKLQECVQICMAESRGFLRAYNDNVVPEGKTIRGLDGRTYTAGQVWQRDCGPMQIAIGAAFIGTDKEEELYDLDMNLRRARVLFNERGWQPWAAYGSEIYLRDTYLKLAARGVGNFLARLMLERVPTDTAGTTTIPKGEPYVPVSYTHLTLPTICSV